MKTLLFTILTSFVLAFSASPVVAQDENPHSESTDQDKAMTVIQFMNYLRYVSYEVSEYQNVFIIEDEYRNLSPDNLQLNKIPDEDIRQAIKDHLQLLYDIRVDEKRRLRFEEGQRKAAQRHRNDIIISILKSGVAQGFEQSALIASAFSGDAASVKEISRALAEESFSTYDNYVNFQRQLEDESEEFRFQFDDAKANRLHEENLKSFDFVYSLVQRYGIPDEYRLRETDAKALIECAKTSDKNGAYDRLKIMAKRQPSFKHFPMFWSHYASFAACSGHSEDALDACTRFEDVNKHSLFRGNRMVAQTAMAKIQSMIDIGKINKQEIARAIDDITNYNYDSHDYDMAFYCASVLYSVMDDTQSALEILDGLIAVQRQMASGELVKYRDLFKNAKEEVPYDNPPMISDLLRCLALRETIVGEKTDDSFRKNLESVFANTILQGVEHLFAVGTVRNSDLFVKAKQEINNITMNLKQPAFAKAKFVVSVPVAWFALGDFPISVDLKSGRKTVETLSDDYSRRKVLVGKNATSKAYVEIEIPRNSWLDTDAGIDNYVLHIPNSSWPISITFLPQEDSESLVPVSVEFIGSEYSCVDLAKKTERIIDKMAKKAKSETKDSTRYSVAIPFPSVSEEIGVHDLVSVKRDNNEFKVVFSNNEGFDGSITCTIKMLNEFGYKISECESKVELAPETQSIIIPLSPPDNLEAMRTPACLYIDCKKKAKGKGWW